MVRDFKITNEKILNLFNSLKDEEVKALFLSEKYALLKLDFVRQHEDTFRSLIPTYYDDFKDVCRGYYMGEGYADRDLFMVYLCFELGILRSDDFTTITNVDTAGVDENLLYHNAKSTVNIFRDSIEKRKDEDKRLIAFVDENPQYLTYFLPLICSIDSDVFFDTLINYIKTANLQDTLRYNIFIAIFQSSNAGMLSRLLDAIEKENFYRFKAINEACVSVGDYTVTLAPKELVAVLRDVVDCNTDKYIDTNFKRAYHFINAYDRVHEDKFRTFAIDILKRGGDRSRGALLNSLSIESINENYAKYIFSCNLTIEDYSFFFYKIHGERMDKAILPTVFEKLFDLLKSMDKVCYHYKMDDDISFARDLYKSYVAGQLGVIAVASNNDEYIKRLDGVYDTLKEEAQASYLNEVGEKTHLDTRLCAIKFLKCDNYTALTYFDDKKIKLNYDEGVTVSDYLKTKKQSIKSKIIKECLASEECDKIMEYLLSCNEDYKKSAGEEMQKSIGKVDDKKLKQKTVMFYWNSQSVFSVEKPVDEIKKLAKQRSDIKPIKPLSYKQVEEFFDAIKNFITEHADYEYEANYKEGLVTLGSDFSNLKGFKTGDNCFDAYPLGSQLKSLIKDNFSREVISGILILEHCVDKRAKKLYKAVCGNKLFGDADKNFNYVNSFASDYFAVNGYNVIRRLDYVIAKELLDEEDILAIYATFAQDSVMDKYEKEEDDDDYCSSYPSMFAKILSESKDLEIFKEFVYQECAFIFNEIIDAFSFDITVRAYEYGHISAELAKYFIVEEGYTGGVFSPDSPRYVMRSDYVYPKFKEFFLDFFEKMIEVEFNRGSLQTPYSQLIERLKRFFGMEKYFKAIVALRGLTWVRSPWGLEKNDVLSHILKNTVKAQGDDYAKFVEFIKQYKITDDELLRATLFNPEFVDYTAQYLKIPNLKLAVFWFIAHLNETLVGDAQERRIEQIKEFSEISYPDFKDGAIDYNWYNEMIEKVPENILKRIYADAKYVTVGGLHKRAQRFFDAINGRIEKSECIERIKASRNKDYCLIYSLIPIESAEDLYERYTFLAEFARSSKQFGAQRQLSERRTIDIAIENLARVAGYASVDIFIFEMEAENPSDIYKTYTVDDIQITPYIDERQNKITYTVKKGDKVVSSIPSKYSKNEVVVFIREQIKTLNQKFRRIITSFEKVMNTRAPFTLEQLQSMSRERIISSVLAKLVFLADGRLCIFDGRLKDIDGRPVNAESVYVAHAIELKKLGLLTNAIEYVAKNNIRQPFKQVLREIYTKTDIELTQDEVLRFKGFEVDVKKCISALKGKGWGVSEDIGLRKVYYTSDTVSAIFRECDFLFTVDFENVNKELHGIFFLKRKSGEIIPIKDVDDITFSETLRDVDLMISISSKVVYDFDLAMSTVEVRQEVLKSIVGILGLDNVSFLKDNIKVQGKWGNYIVNIRTGLVFKEGKGNLAIDTIYSVDKPILLDFVDEDPMTADIISKAIALAGDDKIKDPAILREIKD